jgi:hypothetical protein
VELNALVALGFALGTRCARETFFLYYTNYPTPLPNATLTIGAAKRNPNYWGLPNATLTIGATASDPEAHYYQDPKKCAGTLFCAANKKSAPQHETDCAGTCFVVQVFRHKKKRREVICCPYATFIALDLHHRPPPAASRHTQTLPITSAIILSCW